MALSDHIKKDSPTNNFATLNPLIGGATTLSEGNLYSTISGVNHGAIPNFTLPSSGIWYTEFKFHSIPNGYPAVGLSVYNKIGWNTAGSETDPQSLTFNNSGGTANWEEYGSAFSFSNEVDNINAVINTTNVYALYWDADTNKLTLYDGTNTSSVDVTVNTSQPISFIYAQSSGSTYTVSVNFGQDPTFGGNKTDSAALNPQLNDANGDPTNGAFYYTPPAGAKALCTANLEDITPDVDDDVPKNYMKSVKYTGQTNETGVSTWDSNTSTGTITVGFQPDLVWIKKRSSSSNHFLADSVTGANKELNTNGISAQVPNSSGITSFNTNSFNLGVDGGVNSSSDTYVAWCWKAGGAPTANNSNTSGAMTDDSVSIDGVLQSSLTNNAYTPAGSPTIYPTRMSVNTKAGFSIVKYTGSNSTISVPHGLSSAPEMIIWKALDSPNGSNRGWLVWTKHLSSTDHYLYLNENFGETQLTAGSVLTNSPNSNSFSLGTEPAVNWTSENYIAYCWHSVPGFSAFGSYEGNASTDGPFVYTGFKPAWLMIKFIDGVNDWVLVDTVRFDYNIKPNTWLAANQTHNEGVMSSGYDLDILSNGFKMRTSTGLNSSGTYIYAAFAEQPFKYATAR